MVFPRRMRSSHIIDSGLILLIRDCTVANRVIRSESELDNDFNRAAIQRNFPYAADVLLRKDGTADDQLIARYDTCS